MRQYIVKRLVLIVPTCFIASVLIFSIIRLFPGDIVVLLAEDRHLPKEEYDRELARIGLDKPLITQYLVWMGSMLRGELGNSLLTRRPVIKEAVDRLPVTMELGLLGIFFSLVVGIPLGVVAAVRQDRWGDYVARSIGIGAISIPGFWIATLVILILSLYFHWSPPVKYVSFHVDPLGNLKMFALPAFILGIEMSGILIRMTRTTMLDVLRDDYVRTARAKGLKERVVLTRHAFSNALIPVLMLLGLEVARVIGGTIIIEAIFNLPGFGRWTLTALTLRDYPVIQAVVLFLVVAVLLINIAVDVLHGVLDPRLRLS